MNEKWWMAGVADVCAHFQVDLSCLVDGELDDDAATRAMAHLETCSDCSEFFEGTRLQVRLHCDTAEPARLAERYSMLLGDRDRGEDAAELVHRLATIFYQIGKAYVLTELRPERVKVFEEAVKVEATRAHGRGFVDGVVSRGGGDVGGVDWTSARGMFNGKLSKIEGALDKGLQLLDQALEIDPSHEEARLYRGFAQLHQGQTLRAQREFQRVFRSALDETNRGHAAMQLSCMHAREGDLRQALVYLRWVTMSGLDDLDDRFSVVRFNIAMYYAHLSMEGAAREKRTMKDRSLAEFRRLLDRNPESAGEVAAMFARSPKLQAAIEAVPGFANELLHTCPELFRVDSDGEEIDQ